MSTVLRFAREASHLAMRACGEHWFERGNRMSDFARRCRRPGQTYDSRRAEEFTRMALTYWRASDSMHALADLVFGSVAASGEAHEQSLRDRGQR